MSASGLLGRRRLCCLVSATSSYRRTETSVLCRPHTFLPLVRYFASKTIIESQEETSFTISYLRKCGLSLESAKYVSNYVSFETPEKPDSVINLLKEHGFSNAHISKFIKPYPFLLKTKPTCISPKLEFFHSCGCSNADIVAIFSRNPVLLAMSLDRRIVPSYNIIKSVLLSDLKAIKSFKAYLGYTSLDPAILALNIRCLTELGMPQSSICYALTTYPYILFQSSSRFCEILNNVKHMGFDPLKCYFVSELQVLSTMSKLTVESKLDVLERFGLSRDEAWRVFKEQPLLMHFSKERITKVIDFILNQMQWKSQDIVKFPPIFTYSLEKRTIPRCSVAHLLLSKGLEKEIKLSSLLVVSEEMFVKKYVTSYQGTVPQLLDLYKGKVSLADL